MAPPPTRTAYFSIPRSSGVVLRVQTMRARVPATAATSAAVARRDAAEAAEEIQRDAFGGQNAARRAVDGAIDVARRDARAVGARSTNHDRRIDQAERQRRQVEPGDDARPGARPSRVVAL